MKPRIHYKPEQAAVYSKSLSSQRQNPQHSFLGAGGAPVFHGEPVHAAEFFFVIRHHGAAEGLGVSSDLDVIGTDHDALFFKAGADFGALPRRVRGPIYDGKRPQKFPQLLAGLDGMIVLFRSVAQLVERDTEMQIRSNPRSSKRASTASGLCRRAKMQVSVSSKKVGSSTAVRGQFWGLSFQNPAPAWRAVAAHPPLRWGPHPKWPTTW